MASPNDCHIQMFESYNARIIRTQVRMVKLVRKIANLPLMTKWDFAFPVSAVPLANLAAKIKSFRAAKTRIRRRVMVLRAVLPPRDTANCFCWCLSAPEQIVDAMELPAI